MYTFSLDGMIFVYIYICEAVKENDRGDGGRHEVVGRVVGSECSCQLGVCWLVVAAVGRTELRVGGKVC